MVTETAQTAALRNIATLLSAWISDRDTLAAYSYADPDIALDRAIAELGEALAPVVDAAQDLEEGVTRKAAPDRTLLPFWVHPKSLELCVPTTGLMRDYAIGQFDCGGSFVVHSRSDGAVPEGFVRIAIPVHNSGTEDGPGHSCVEWSTFADIPADVDHVRDADGCEWRRGRDDDWILWVPTRQMAEGPARAPFSRVEVEKPAPRSWPSLDKVPHDVVVEDRNGTRFEWLHAAWRCRNHDTSPASWSVPFVGGCEILAPFTEVSA